MGARQARNLAAAKQFYDAGPADDDAGRREQFAEGFVWHVPGDNNVSGDYSGAAYFVDMPGRMEPLDEWRIDILDLAANQDLVIAVGRLRGQRHGRRIEAAGGHVFRFDDQARIVEAWGWCAEQAELDAFFAG